MAKNNVTFRRNKSTGEVEVIKNGKKAGKVVTMGDPHPSKKSSAKGNTKK